MLFAISTDRTPFGKTHLGFWPFIMAEVTVHFFTSILKLSVWLPWHFEAFRSPKGRNNHLCSNVFLKDHYSMVTQSDEWHEWPYIYLRMLYFRTINRKLMAGVVKGMISHMWAFSVRNFFFSHKFTALWLLYIPTKLDSFKSMLHAQGACSPWFSCLASWKNGQLA